MLNFSDLLLNKFFKIFNLIKRPDYQNNLFFKGDPKSLPFISVVIPIVEKDLEILKFNIANLRKFCQNPISEIFVVSPQSDKIKNACSELNITWINEIDVAPVSKETIHNLLGESFRVNWFYQQFIKLNLDKIISENYYLVLDADTILLSEQYFVDNERMILKVSDEFHYLYQITNKKLLDNFSFNFRSFIAHHQLISRDILIDLKSRISGGNDKILWSTILSKIKSNGNWFSEYELYGNFAIQFYEKEVKTVYWFNKNQYRKHFSNSDIDSISKKYASVSFHNYDYKSYKK